MSTHTWPSSSSRGCIMPAVRRSQHLSNSFTPGCSLGSTAVSELLVHHARLRMSSVYATTLQTLTRSSTCVCRAALLTKHCGARGSATQR